MAGKSSGIAVPSVGVAEHCTEKEQPGVAPKSNREKQKRRT
nr:MAG TPA: hypothetical protein [Ackermannviridae sp.]